METENNRKYNIFGLPYDSRPNKNWEFTGIYNSEDISAPICSNKKFELKSPMIKNESQSIEYRLLVNAFFSEEDPEKPYAEVVLVPDYRSLNTKNKQIVMKEIINNDVQKLKKFDVFSDMWCHGIGICLLQQTEGFLPLVDEADFREKFFIAFQNIYRMIIQDVDLYLDRFREKPAPSYWDELNSYCS